MLDPCLDFNLCMSIWWVYDRAIISSHMLDVRNMPSRQFCFVICLQVRAAGDH